MKENKKAGRREGHALSGSNTIPHIRPLEIIKSDYDTKQRCEEIVFLARSICSV